MLTSPVKSNATSVRAYLEELPPDRRAAIERVRNVILNSLDPVYEEGIQYGMIGYYVPHSFYPPGYHANPQEPLPFVSLASQKNHMAVYLGCVYNNPEHERWFRAAWAKSGKKLDMGKSCLRFRRVDDLALEVLGEAIRRVPAKVFIKNYEAAIGRSRRAGRGRRPPRQAPKNAV